MCTFGSGEDGRLGHGDDEDSDLPTGSLVSLTMVVVVATAAAAVGLTDDGCCGRHGGGGSRQWRTSVDEAITIHGRGVPLPEGGAMWR